MSKNNNFQHIMFYYSKNKSHIKKYMQNKDELIVENDFKNLEMKILI